MKEENVNNSTAMEQAVVNNQESTSAITNYEEWYEKVDKIAETIADMYIQKHPRQTMYGVTLTSTEDDSEMTYYKRLSKEDLSVLRKYLAIKEEEGISLEEYLEGEGMDELRDRLAENDSPYCLNYVEDVDLDDTRKFTKFSMQVQDKDGSLRSPYIAGVPMTDEEYKDLFITLMKQKNRLSMNQLVYLKPELAQRIMSHLAGVYNDWVCEMTRPFICDLYELKQAVESVMDPFKDELNLFHSQDADVLRFAKEFQIIPDNAEGEEIFVEHSDNDSFHCLFYLQGTDVYLYQEGVAYEDNDGGDIAKWHDVDDFTCDAKTLMKAFGVEQPEEIFHYLKENYGTRDCLDQVRSALNRIA